LFIVVWCPNAVSARCSNFLGSKAIGKKRAEVRPLAGRGRAC
jgi:hypothetical protein